MKAIRIFKSTTFNFFQRESEIAERSFDKKFLFEQSIKEDIECSLDFFSKSIIAHTCS